MSLKMKYLAKLKQILKVNYNENVDNIMKLKLTCWPTAPPFVFVFVFVITVWKPAHLLTSCSSSWQASNSNPVFARDWPATALQLLPTLLKISQS